MSPVWIPIVGMMIPITLVPVILGLRHARVERQLEHAERMKALEVGRTLPQDEPWWNPGKVCVAIGAGVPVGVFFCAWMATLAVGFREGIWREAAVVGSSAVVCGSILAAKLLAHRAPVDDGAVRDAKPVPGVDAYDFAGSRD